MKFANLLPATTVYAHCDLPCGVYDPAQARIEAESVLSICKKYQQYTDKADEVFRIRCIIIKDERAELVKHHLSVLWSDYFKPEHIEAHPEIHDLFWRAIRQAGQAKHHTDVETAQKLLDLIGEITEIFYATKKAQS